MCEISIDRFAEIMHGLAGKLVWVDVITECVVVPVLYDNFEFLEFEDKIQFGHGEYDESNAYQNLIIELEDIVEILRDRFAPYIGNEELILDLVDNTRIIVRSE